MVTLSENENQSNTDYMQFDWQIVRYKHCAYDIEFVKQFSNFICI